MKSVSQIQAGMAASAVPFTLIDTVGGAYVPIYLAPGEKSARLGSVNAGNSNAFFVGGGGLNASFANTVPDPNGFLPLQTALYNSVTGSRIASQAYPTSQAASFAMVQLPAPGQVFNNYEGTVFIDVFPAGLAPKGNPANYAMVYVCPPNGQIYTSPSAFLTAVEATALNLITAVSYYNQQLVPATTGLATIQILRVFLFSSSIYKQAQTTLDAVAQAVCSGLLNGLAHGPTGLTAIQLPNGKSEYASVAPAAPKPKAAPKKKAAPQPPAASGSGGVSK